MNEQDADIAAILGGMTRVAIVGISADPSRPSNEVAAYLLSQGFNVALVNPHLDAVFGIPCYPDLQSVPGTVEIVDVFRRSEEAGAVVDDAIAIKARAVWMQEGVIDEDAAKRARAVGLVVVMNRCMLKEHARRAAADPGFA
ncbi:MAG: CoA-binding protein [Candidatus Binatia bacterium]